MNEAPGSSHEILFGGAVEEAAGRTRTGHGECACGAVGKGKREKKEILKTE